MLAKELKRLAGGPGMSNVQYALLRREGPPDRIAWQAAIDECGFDFQLDPQLDTARDRGFSPGTLMGGEGGFELYSGPISELPEAAPYAAGRDCWFAFRTGSSMAECASMMIACYALAKQFDAVILPAADMDGLLQEIMDCIEEVRRGR